MIEVYDDIMPRSYNKLLNEIVTHMSFEWHYLHDVTYETHGKEGVNVPGFTHLLYQDGEGGPHVNTFYPPLAEYLDIKGQEISKLHRIRVGCLLSNNTGVNNKHVDFPFPHKVGLYYINDCDGPTYIWTPDGLEEVSPKKNRLVVFDGKYEHASSCPKDSPSRFVCTYNFTAK